MAQSIIEKLRANGVEARLVSLDALKSVKKEYRLIERSSALWNDYYKRLVFDVPEDIKRARSILVAAMQSSAVSVTFRAEETKSLLLPPTYLVPERQYMSGLIEHTFTDGSLAWQAGLPHKLLAVISGLARYGRNNITYTDSFGSYQLLQTYITTAEPENELKAVEFVRECDTCFACVTACPTGAVKKRGLRIDPERCLTRYNERSEPFPEWLPSGAHNSIVGCMRCQLACPLNEGKLKTVQGPVFEEDETRLIRSGAAYEHLPETAREKLRSIDYDGNSYDDLARNIRALLT